MIKSIVKKLAKKYILSTIQELVDARASEVSKWAGIVGMWILRGEKALAFLNGLSQKLGDGKLSDEEGDAIVEEAGALVKEW